MNDRCFCGHVLDEHEDTALAPCTVEGCHCVAFDLELDDGEEDDR